MILIKCDSGCVHIPSGRAFSVWAENQSKICVTADNITFVMNVDGYAYQWAEDIAEMIGDNLKLGKDNIIVDLAKFVPKRLRGNTSAPYDSKYLKEAPIAIYTRTLSDRSTEGAN